MPTGRGQRRSVLLPTVAVLAALALAAERISVGAFLPAPGPLRRDALIQGFRAAGVVGLGAFAQAPAALADAPKWEGNFDDPNHPGCKRQISIVFGEVVQIDGADGEPGCKKGSGRQNRWKLKAKLPSPEGPLLVDFSPKGGPSDVKGEWKDGGIVFPDGNKWTKIELKQDDFTKATQTVKRGGVLELRPIQRKS